MRILGVAGLMHDPSVALLDNGRIRMAIESEKVTRRKGEIPLCPDEAIRFILRETQTRLDEVDYIAANWKPGPFSNAFYLNLLRNFIARRCFPWQLLTSYLVTWGSPSPEAFLRLHESAIPPIV